MIYLLDANSFIEAKLRHYRMRVVPAYWEWLLKPHKRFQLQSIDQVYNELTHSSKKVDDLHLWSKSQRHFFRDSKSQTDQANFAKIANYVSTHSRYKASHKTKFLGGADPWLIAKAMTLGATIVTHEKPVDESSTRVKIPNVASEFNVSSTDIFDVLEASGDQFIL
ncbi:DUF4411 family protein [Pseudidiomarina sp. E22-M8]|uniref:DUF4411 family protein n=1 Tax=Pseudidiomarina sp. E22-M8 TaxID=3424768 RepID=UPI00403D534E